jgi:hypothetical protein
MRKSSMYPLIEPLPADEAPIVVDVDVVIKEPDSDDTVALATPSR